MGKALVIVESPAKAKTINKYLGKDYIVKSSVGHVRDLPSGGSAKAPVDPKERAKQAAITRKMSPDEKVKHKAAKAKAQLFNRMGINPEQDWEAQYEVLPGKEKVIKELVTQAEKADEIYLATDLDREGEAIAWHLREIIGGDSEKYKRVVFNEITKKAIQSAFDKPSAIDMDFVNAQQARRFLDRVVGFMVSPLLWKKVARGLSAGRVQSVAVRLIVEREREIRAFLPEEYWDLHADLKSKAKHLLRMQVNKKDGKEFKPTSKEQIDAELAVLNQASYEVLKREDKPSRSRPGAPYITSTLQQAASTRLKYSVKKTMMLAQRLYEAGYITYMRTDSTNLSADAVATCRDLIEGEYGDKYLPKEAISYSSKEGAQEAHEAIRPSDVGRRGNELMGMEPDAVKLYDMIWRQFVACQMTAAEYDVTTLTVVAENYELRAKGRVTRFDGWTRVQPPMKKNDDDVSLPDLKPGESLDLKELLPKQHFTKPSPRFSEAALVKELEKRGIGRPSTYASIISTIQDRGYVSLRSRRFYAEKMGEIVTDRLLGNFSDLLDYSFTASMEENLDAIAGGDKNWKQTLNEFYKDFVTKLQQAEAEPEDGGMKLNNPVVTDITCPKCEKNPLTIRTATTGVFLGCAGFALKKEEQCKNTINLVPGDEAEAVDKDEEAESRNLRAKHRCAKCGAAMDSYLIDEQRKLHVCGNSPSCDGFEVEQGTFKIKGYDGPLIECDKCGSDMQLKSGRFGKYFGCTNEECKNTRKLLKNGEAAPPKADPIPMPHLQCRKVEDTYVLRDGASGIFLAASQFPKNRETRPPLVEEILTVKDQLDPKFAYLTEAPTQDSDGNKSVIRFSRKSKEQYVMSENEDGKATGWSAHYKDGSWVVTEKKSKAKS
ncbi:type I DNA topoisomerase [Pleionea sp. CnH1-48]|uniref:type I DNA topoisomerase n=1 Tax=Pleionea sp. CnH1-48 TaxID=2954494 RepID=UPI002096F731|nr:type I DNA topoisomerase [Pleionea sp. CnH1-48]MCO7225400.1 type I DNA topoisomerase [Pleionea sp. CnH1-48]